MNKKAIFLDLDGTILDFGGVLYDDAKLAITKALENGHKVFLSTGRSKSFVDPQVLALGLSDGIYSAGAHVTCEENTIYSSSFSAEQYDKIIECMTRHKGVFAIESQDGEFIPKQLFTKHLDTQEALVKIGAKVIDTLPTSAIDIDKIIYIFADCHRPILAKELEGICQIIPSSYIEDDLGGEIMQVGLNKAEGIKKILEYYNIDIKDTVGIGDSNNDFEMVQLCNIGIAMGNACQGLKAVADHVTDTVKNGGLYKAFEFIGVI